MPEGQTASKLPQWTRHYLANLSTEIEILTKLLDLATKLNTACESSDELAMRAVRKEQSRIGLMADELRQERIRLLDERQKFDCDSDENRMEQGNNREIATLENHRDQLLSKIKRLNNQSVILLKDQIVQLHSQLSHSKTIN